MHLGLMIRTWTVRYDIIGLNCYRSAFGAGDEARTRDTVTLASVPPSFKVRIDISRELRGSEVSCTCRKETRLTSTSASMPYYDSAAIYSVALTVATRKPKGYPGIE